MHRIAVIGSGIAGLAAARRLASAPGGHGVTLLEAGSHFGGHANTVDMTLEGVSQGVDTGFLVFNHRTYPLLKRLFEELQVPTAAAEMSFSVQVPQADGSAGLEWSGSSLRGVFAQRRNLLRPRFLKMLAEILRFNRLATRIAQEGNEARLHSSIEVFLDDHGFGPAFRQDYLLPMMGCIWSCPTDQMLRFPVATLIRFCHNHGLVQVTNRPQWYTVRGGTRHYVRRIVAALQQDGRHEARLNTPVLGLRRMAHGVLLQTAHGTEQFDAVVLACHSDQSLRLLGTDATPQEHSVLGAIRYQPNQAVLHTDTSVLPHCEAAWAAWNYERAADAGRDQAGVCLHYLLNRLQPLPWQQPVMVSLNPVRPIDDSRVHARIAYSHPVFDLAAIEAQAQVGALQGQRRTWFCGAWCGYGFHEDGLRSGLDAADSLLHTLQTLPSSPAIEGAA
ncbi:NAD(P)/FAD-dependent oxidoreductase [Comamonas terrigena]|uniref:NAD(P)/FAD-dependent oxidoreductase n=1 Tax=Comamonas terrigena TaxID=32013 RepID=UPI002447F414|nr:FAD-dependent oxidoreductase [Comamonas terrigena]MDH0050340.1 FAD-dependent oxidoreductase [Comamonas terrigena]MDH0512796.1 FAD-dependent oxidoreductase [Comamonas terrigena]MDH1092125.1 FAD-dependent oxidoreductase [Comamonas terrigena]MDH1501076.1 FAD-dependent oxidoreductase [Comamonas terrigena]